MARRREERGRSRGRLPYSVASVTAAVRIVYPSGKRSPAFHSPVRILAGILALLAVAAGEAHSVALRADGTVWSWGSGRYGALGDGRAHLSATPVQVRDIADATAVAAGAYHGMARLKDGTIRAWGEGSRGRLGNGASVAAIVPVAVAILNDATAFASGPYHSLAVRADGSVWGAWGGYDYYPP